jgi:hypothetical protein
MAVLTGSNGQLKYEGTPVAKCRDWSISVSADGLETTCLAGYDRTYVKGLRGTTGSATLLYDPTDKSGVALLNSIFLDENNTDSLQFVLDKADGTQFDCEGFLTSVSPSISVGAVQAVSVSFQVSGKPTGLF